MGVPFGTEARRWIFLGAHGSCRRAQVGSLDDAVGGARCNIDAKMAWRKRAHRTGRIWEVSSAKEQAIREGLLAAGHRGPTHA